VLSRAEVMFLMKISGKERLVGTNYHNEKLLENEEFEAEKSLLEKGIIFRADTVLSISQNFQSLFQCVFSPRSALIVVRDLPDLGKQLLIYLYREGNFVVLHSMPETGVHRFEALEKNGQVREMLLKWFPLSKYSATSASFVISEQEFEQLRDSVLSGNYDRALAVLEQKPGDEIEKKNLVDALSNRVISGSFAVLSIINEEAVDAFSLAVFAGNSTAWALVLNDSEKAGQSIFRIFRIGQNFDDLIKDLLKKL